MGLTRVSFLQVACVMMAGFTTAWADDPNTAVLDNLQSTSAATGGEGPSDNRSQADGSSILKKFDEDTEITDAKLKADAGSLSVLSLRFSLSYYGASPSDLSALNQPNPDGVVTKSATAVSGTVGMRYRLSPTTTLSFYAGVSDLYAFHPQQSLDFNSPAVSYDTTFKLWGIQFLSSPSVNWTTEKVYTSTGEFGGIGYYLSGTYNLGRTGWAIGSENSLGYYFFNRGYEVSDGKVRRINLSLAPFVKYNFTDKFNANTQSSVTIYNLRRDDDPLNSDSRLVAQKLAVGYAFSRDIYVSPYLMFYPTQITLAETTVNLLTSFSIL